MTPNSHDQLIDLKHLIVQLKFCLSDITF